MLAATDKELLESVEESEAGNMELAAEAEADAIINAGTEDLVVESEEDHLDS